MHDENSINEWSSLKNKLSKVLNAYLDHSSGERAHQRLAEVLQNNDCRDSLAAIPIFRRNDVGNAFIRAARMCHIDLLKAFLRHGVPVDIRDYTNQTALSYAAGGFNEDVVRLLLDHNPDVNFQNEFGHTPLMTTSGSGRMVMRRGIEIVKLLLERNAAIDMRDKLGRTALMYASQQGEKAMVELLLNHNADIDLRDNEGKRAADHPRTEEISELLRNYEHAVGYILK